MQIQSIAAAEEQTRTLLAALCQDCGRGDLEVAAPGQETGAPLLLIVDRAALLERAPRYPKVLAEHSLRCEPPLPGRALTTYSLSDNGADYTARNLRVTPEGFTAFEIVGTGCIGRVRLHRLPVGGQNAILSAVSAAAVCGVPFAEVLQALQKRCSG